MYMHNQTEALVNDINDNTVFKDIKIMYNYKTFNNWSNKMYPSEVFNSVSCLMGQSWDAWNHEKAANKLPIPSSCIAKTEKQSVVWPLQDVLM